MMCVCVCVCLHDNVYGEGKLCCYLEGNCYWIGMGYGEAVLLFGGELLLDWYGNSKCIYDYIIT